VPLSDVQIRSLKPRDRIYKISDANSLYLEVHPTGARLWRFKYTWYGKQKRIALGAYPEVGLAEARRRRDEARQKIYEGIDPAAERKRQKLVAKFKASNSFGDLAGEYIEMVTEEGRSEATVEKMKWLLEKLRSIADMPIADLQAVDLFAVLKKIETQGRYETARRCRSFASRVFRYAAASGRGDSDPTTLLRGALIAPKPKHHAALLEPEEVGGFLRALDGYSGYPITLLACKILPHVMARPGELRLARWAEFDFEKAVWTVPPERMKMRRPHYVPLSRQVIALLEELRPYVGGEDYVFPAFHTWKRPLSKNTMNAAYRRMGYGPRDLTAHGFRATASSLLNQCGKWNPDAIERSLAHADGNQIRRIYNRTVKRRSKGTPDRRRRGTPFSDNMMLVC
jgi:integrase